MSHTNNTTTGVTNVDAVENETVNTNTVINESEPINAEAEAKAKAKAEAKAKKEAEAKAKKEAEAKANQKVKVGFVITQMGKHPFSIIHETEAKLKDITLVGLARKTGYALADSLHNFATKAMDAKAKHGSYITAFRPKSVFKIQVSVNGVICFHAVETKGLDAIRIMNGKGEILSRSLIVDKFDLIANAVQSANSFIDMVQFVAETEAKAEAEATV